MRIFRFIVWKKRECESDFFMIDGKEGRAGLWVTTKGHDSMC